MSREDLELTERGFAVYGKGVCSNGINWSVIESSIAGDPHVRLYVDGDLCGTKQDGSLHLTVEQATQLRDHLNRFLADANDPEHWKNSPEYIETWRNDEESEDE